MELEFNEDKAIKYIKSQLPIGVNYDDDDILNVIDIIVNSNGELTLNIFYSLIFVKFQFHN